MTAAKLSVFVKMAKPIVRTFAVNGIDARRLLYALVALPRFIRDLISYNARNAADKRFPLRLSCLYPCLADYRDSSGTANGHYFHQDLLVARKIRVRTPQRHIDIGSRIDGFIAHLLCFMPVECIDIRPLESKIQGLSFLQSDATEMIEFETGSIDSVSSLHAAEHFGLGRYGDPVDPSACFRYMRALARILAPGGRLYFSVPVGRERVEFNAHRVFAPATILQAFSDLTLVSFSAVGDDGDLLENARPEDAANAQYACGIFEFTKA